MQIATYGVGIVTCRDFKPAPFGLRTDLLSALWGRMRITCAVLFFGAVFAVVSSQLFADPAWSETPAKIYDQLLQQSRKDPQRTLQALEAGIFKCIPSISKSDEGSKELSFMLPKMLIKMVETAHRGVSRETGREEMKAWLKSDLGGYVSSLSDRKATFVVATLSMMTKDPSVRVCIAKAAL